MKNYDLICKAKQGDNESMEILLELYAGLINKIANYYYYHLKVTHLELEEIVTEGQIGFIESVNKFDLTRECELSTYATFVIRNSILNALRETSIVKFTTRDISNQMKKNKENKNNPDKSTTLFNVNLIDTAENMELCMHYSDKSDSSYLNSEVEDIVINSTYKKKITNLVKDSLSTLSYNEFLIITNFFGFNNTGECLNLKEISKKYDIPYTQVRKFKTSAISKLQNYFKKSNNNILDIKEII